MPSKTSSQTKEPILKQRIVVTQRADLAAPLVALLKKCGAQVLQVPVTKWTPPPNLSQFDKMLAMAKLHDWLLFSNPHAVRFFFKRYLELFGNFQGLANVRMGAYGPMTGRTLLDMRLKPVAISANHKTRLIVDAIRKAGPVDEKHFLVIMGDPKRAVENVPEALEDLGAHVEILQGYAVEMETRDLTGDANDLLKNGADWILFSCALAIKHFNRRFDIKSLLTAFPKIRFAVTNTTLCKSLEKTGAIPTVVARPQDPNDLIDKIRECCK